MIRPTLRDHQRASNQALGGMDCWAGDDIRTHKIAQPVGPARWQVIAGLAIAASALAWALH